MSFAKKFFVVYANIEFSDAIKILRIYVNRKKFLENPEAIRDLR
jgi:hypothetical protein